MHKFGDLAVLYTNHHYNIGHVSEGVSMDDNSLVIIIVPQ